MTAQLPEPFIHNILNAFGEDGKRWLVHFDSTLATACRRWHLTPGEPFLLSYNYVASARTSDGREVVLKIGVPNRELTSEIEALKWYAGSGAVRLLEGDPESGFLLMERLEPGAMLVTLSDDDQAAEIASRVMSRLWRPAPDAVNFIRLRDWFDELKNLRPHYNGGTGKFPRKLIETVEGSIDDLFAEDSPPVLLHGDFHHYNILSRGDDWLAIDPKGVIGPREYEIAPFMLNPIFEMHPDFKRQAGRRLDIFSGRLGLDRKRLLAWTIAHSVLSAWWDLNPADDSGGDYALACGEIFLQMQ
jgi:streptomycin 6-kinase